MMARCSLVQRCTASSSSVTDSHSSVPAAMRCSSCRRSGESWRLATTLGFLCESLVALGRLAEAHDVHGELVPMAELLQYF